MTDLSADRRTQHTSLVHYTSITFMVYGRVIGNELRDVPPECLPIWGQRWSGYRAPHGPSPFSTRVFIVDQMCQVGPALTSPTQFEVTLAEEDGAEDASSETSRFRSSSLSSPLAIQAEATELTSWPETPRSIHRSSHHPHNSPVILHPSNGHPPPQNSARLSVALLARRQSEQPETQDCGWDPLLHPPDLRHEIRIHDGHGPRENDYSLWDVDCTSTSIQLQAGHSYPSQIPSGQLQDVIPPHSIPEWQFENTHTQSLAYPFPSSQSGNGCLSLPLQTNDRTSGPTTPPSFSYCCTTLDAAVDLSRNRESSITRISGIEQLPYPMMPSWPPGSTLSNSSFPEPLQDVAPPPTPGEFYHLVSDHHEPSTSRDDFLDTFAHAERCTALSVEKPGAWR